MFIQIILRMSVCVSNVQLNVSLTDSTQQRRDGVPDADAALPQTLTDGQLQIQQRQTLEDQRDQVRDQERT